MQNGRLQGKQPFEYNVKLLFTSYVKSHDPGPRTNGFVNVHRFHSLEEFDEGKRSCRKRLDGHNRRRRKPQPYVNQG